VTRSAGRIDDPEVSRILLFQTDSIAFTGIIVGIQNQVLRQRVVNFVRDRNDLRPDVRSDIAFDQVVYLVQADQRADRRFGHHGRRIDQQLLRQLDDGAVGAADVLAGSALHPETRNDVDDEFDLVRQERIKIDEALPGQGGERDVSGDARVEIKPRPVVVVELAENRLGRGGLLQDASARHFRDIRRLQVNLQGEAVHQLGELNPAIIQTTHDLAEALLRGDRNPVFAPPLYAELLHNPLEVEHLLGISGDELANLVDHEHEGVARFAALHELDDAVRQPSGGDVHLRAALRPGVRHRVGGRIELVQDGARLIQGEDCHAFLIVPILAVQRLEGLLELLEPAFRLQPDFKFGQVDILGVTQARQEQAVHDLG
jgi:hypothetical protein